MKVTVLGAGAVGAMLGGLIKRNDPSVEMLFIARGEHGQQMRRQGGVVLRGPWGGCLVPLGVSCDVADLAGSDYVLLTVKSQMTEEIMRQAHASLGDAVLVSVQNGLNQGVLARYVRPDRLLAGMTAANMAVVAPGTISLLRRGMTVVGPCSPHVADEVVRRTVDVLRKTGLRAEASRHIEGTQYNKLVMNTVGYTSALSGSSFFLDAILHRPWRRAVALPMLDEGLRVLEAARIRLDRLPEYSDVIRFRRLLQILDMPLVDSLVRTTARPWFPRSVYSVYHDLVRGRKTEIDFVSGQIVRLAGEHGVEAPCNALVLEMARELESRGDGTIYTRDEVITRFRAIGVHASLGRKRACEAFFGASDRENRRGG